MDTDHKVEEREVVSSSPEGEYEHHEKIIENYGAARQQTLQRVEHFIWFVFYAVDALIALRFMLKLIAANPANPFAHLIYSFAGLLLGPFSGLTIIPSAEGIVLEIPDLIAMVAYLLVAWLLVSIIDILFQRSNSRNVTIYDRRRE